MLEVIEATGPNAEHLLGTKVAAGDGLAGMSWVSREVELDTALALESKTMPAEALAQMTSAAAIPLIHDDKVFAVLLLYSAENLDDDPGFRSTLQAIGDRVSPLVVSSISLDRSASNALIDAVTQLPNERAFYLVLENQLAESLRFRDERPLTVLSVDIKDFTEVNQTFGYSAGDLILGFVAKVLSLHLRKMDFLARSTNDEFLIVLPTASERLAGEIVQRIRHRFASEPFSITETDEIKIWLNVGWATFWHDGETGEQLLQNARLRKQQEKAEEPANVIWFPKEYVN
jgi:diguanylate cyclase (GGDEF)-like protein